MQPGVEVRKLNKFVNCSFFQCKNVYWLINQRCMNLYDAFHFYYTLYLRYMD